jgi:hypothetical protein
MWREGFIEDPDIGHYNVTARNESAVHRMHSNVTRGIALNAKTLPKEKGAIFEFFRGIPGKIIENFLQLDDYESRYSTFSEPNGSKHHEQLAIIFSGAYNGGVPCVPEELTPFTLTSEKWDYTAKAKESWKKYFPTITMIQRNTKIDKSIYERFLLKRNSTSSSSSSNSLITPKSVRPSSSYSSSSSNVNESLRDSSFESFLTMDQSSEEKSKQEKKDEEYNNLLLEEYVMNDNHNSVSELYGRRVVF